MERRLAAILAADVAGYSRLMERDEASAFEHLRAHRKELFEPEIAKHRGRIFKLMGDGLLAEFGSVVDAVECAVTLQRGMAERNTGVPDEQRIDVRIGINLGDVIVEGDDRHGDGVNIAARLQQLAEPGGIVVSRTVCTQVKNKLSVGFESLGEQRVKNIDEPIGVFRIAAAGAAPRRFRLRRLAATTRWILSAAILMLLLLIAGGAFWMLNRQPSAAPPVFDRPSIAVLPFSNLADDPKWERFADGVTEDIITDLSHSKDLYVIARNSTMIYKDKPIDIRQIGRDLGVHYVLEGSIQGAGDKVRVTAQLIDTASGSHVWSERYDRTADDIFAVQVEITEMIATRLTAYQGVVAGAERQLAHRKAPGSLTAFDYYLLGMEAKHTMTAEGFVDAEGFFRKALEADPNMARAHVGLVYTYSFFIDYGIAMTPSEALQMQMRAAQKAVALDPGDGETHLTLGQAYAYHGEFEKAAAEFERAYDLSPGNADLLMAYAWNLPGLGDSQRAIQLAEHAVQLNPRYPDWYLQGQRMVYFFGEKFDTSLELTKRIKQPMALDYAFIAMDATYLGDAAEAKAAAAEVERLDPNWTAEAWISGQGGFARERETNLFVEGARKAGLRLCVSNDVLKQQSNFLRLKICDEQRARGVSG
jgi:TolB-like protein/class 3 adenylate cyclase